MLETASLRWIGSAESAAQDLSYDYFIMYALGLLAALIFVCWCLIIQFQLYQMCPGWGPIRKFDADGTEEMRINQLLIHEANLGIAHTSTGDKGAGNADVAFLAGMLSKAHGEATGLLQRAKNSGNEEDVRAEVAEAGGGPVFKPINNNGLYTGFQEDYGTIGRCTWGYCESPAQWGEPMWDPNYGNVVVRHGFADTQWMRSHSRTWARDEIQYQRDHGFTAPPLTLADESCNQVSHRMVIERGGY